MSQLNVPISPDNHNYYPMLHLIPRLLETYPNLAVLVISMHAERTLIKSVMQTGVNGYILKDDYATIRELGAVVLSVSQGGVYFSQQAHQALNRPDPESQALLTRRRLEVLSLCAAHPDMPTAELAHRLGVTHSTVRNLLAHAYVRLNVNNRAAAIAKAQQLSLITGPSLRCARRTSRAKAIQPASRSFNAREFRRLRECLQTRSKSASSRRPEGVRAHSLRLGCFAKDAAGEHLRTLAKRSIP